MGDIREKGLSREEVFDPAIHGGAYCQTSTPQKSLNTMKRKKKNNYNYDTDVVRYLSTNRLIIFSLIKQQ